LLALAQTHVRLLPVRAAAGKSSLPLDLAVRDARANAFDFRPEQTFDGPLDLGLVRIRRDVKHDRPAVLAKDRGLLSDERPADHIGELHEPRASCNFSSALFVTTIRRASATSRARTRAVGTSDT